MNLSKERLDSKHVVLEPLDVLHYVRVDVVGDFNVGPLRHRLDQKQDVLVRLRDAMVCHDISCV